jgi:hypothetical protein
MPDDQRKKRDDESARIDEKHLQKGKIEYEHAGEDEGKDDTREGEADRGSHSRIEQVPQAPLEGPRRREVNEADEPGEIAENMGLDQTFATDEADAEGDDQEAGLLPEQRKGAGR